MRLSRQPRRLHQLSALLRPRKAEACSRLGHPPTERQPLVSLSSSNSRRAAQVDLAWARRVVCREVLVAELSSRSEARGGPGRVGRMVFDQARSDGGQRAAPEAQAGAGEVFAWPGNMGWIGVVKEQRWCAEVA